MAKICEANQFHWFLIIHYSFSLYLLSSSISKAAGFQQELGNCANDIEAIMEMPSSVFFIANFQQSIDYFIITLLII